MLHVRTTVALSALLAPTLLGATQQAIQPSRMHPIRGEVKHAGTVDVTTGKWTRPKAQHQNTKAFGIQIIYRNNCTWQTAGYFAGFEPCEDNYDEGRVPSPSSPGAPPGAASTNEMNSFEVSYCTIAGDVSGIGGYDMDVAFYDNLGGDCVGGIAPTPPAPSALATAYFALAGLGLPGSTAAGFQACWIVGFDVGNTGWFMASDGDGTFDNDGALDKFTWMQRQNTFASPLGYPSATPDGFLIAGEPLSGGFGACSYNIACGTDILFGNSCGTGLDTFDNHWINVDGIAAGDTSGATPSGCPNAVSQYGFGTNCYFFGGYPSNPYSSYWLTLESERRGVACGQPNSCGNNTPPTSSLPTSTPFTIGSTTTSWTIGLAGVPAAPNPGILIYGTGGIIAVPISTAFGNLCLSPFFRAPVVEFPMSTSGGCATTSSYSWDFGSFVNTNAFTNGLLGGNSITIQAWYRDPTNPGSANFSQATGSWPLSSVPPPVVSGFAPGSGGESTALTVSGSGFGTIATDVKVLVASGRGVADVGMATDSSLSTTVFAVGQAGTGGTGMGPVTVVRGAGRALSDFVLPIGPTTSTSSLTRLILGGVGTNSAGSFDLNLSSNATVNAVSGAPVPGGLSINMTGVPGNTLQIRMAFKAAGGDFRVFETRIDFSGTPPNADAKAQHVAQQLAAQFGDEGIQTSSSGPMVRITMGGSTYGSVIVKGV